MSKLRAILVAGPTACGKTDFVIRLASMRGMPPCVVINADSMQVYSGIRITTARPTLEQESTVMHRLFGFINPKDRFSVGRWVEVAHKEFILAEQQGLLPIFVGGTGLYFKSLTQGLSQIPDVPGDVFERWRVEGELSGASALHKVLLARDPEMAAILPSHDVQRIVRALSVLDATGVSLLSWWKKKPAEPILNISDCIALCLSPERMWLRERIRSRVDNMIRSGALDEIRDLKKLGLHSSLPVMSAHGVRELLAYLNGDANLLDSIEKFKNSTCRYAKRQRTWFQHQMPDWWSVCYNSETILEACCYEMKERFLAA